MLVKNKKFYFGEADEADNQFEINHQRNQQMMYTWTMTIPAWSFKTTISNDLNL